MVKASCGIKTFGVKYLGSKNKLIPHIVEIVEKLPMSAASSSSRGRNGKTAIDVFTGTTRVAQCLRQLDYGVVTSDLSYAAKCFSDLFICHPKPEILVALADELNQKFCDTPTDVVLKSFQPDWITKNYCDVLSKSKRPIRVWKPKNGLRADAIRNEIERWKGGGIIDAQTASALVGILILALDKVDNTVGVQQSYLTEWKAARADNDLRLDWSQQEPLSRLQNKKPGQHLVGNSQVLKYPPAFLAYLDPPYTSHNYGSYYHIWDSIALWDKPKVGLSTNRREDRIFQSETLADKDFLSSPWYSAKTASGALADLVKRLPVEWIVLSYSNEGLISWDEMVKIFENLELSGDIASFQIEEIDYKRNIMSKIGRGAVKDEQWTKRRNLEFLVLISKPLE